jgi:hypothetical protein
MRTMGNLSQDSRCWPKFELGTSRIRVRNITVWQSHTEAGQRANTDTRTAYLMGAPRDLARRRAAAPLMDFQPVGVERAPTVPTRHQVRLQHTASTITQHNCVSCCILTLKCVAWQYKGKLPLHAVTVWVQSFRWIPTFRSKMLFQYSGSKSV